MRYLILVMLVFLLSTQSHAAILVFSPNGTYVTKTTLSTAATAADVAGKTVVVTSALSAVQSNISSATVHAWPSDRALRFESGGSIANTTKFHFADGNNFTSYVGHVFKGAGIITGIKKPIPQYWGAIADDAIDDSTAIQLALDCADSSGGGGIVQPPPGTYLVNTPLVIYNGTNLIGDSKSKVVFRKDSTTTKAVTIYTTTFNIYYENAGVLPSDINAILCLTGTGGRFTGTVSGITFEGTLSTTSHESQKVELGIVSLGSIGDAKITGNVINTVKYGLLLQTSFASEISGNRINECLYGFGSDSTSTSMTIFGNLVNDCRSYGFYFRALYYSKVFGNAVDYLNRRDWYPDTTVLSQAYVVRSCTGSSFTNNGVESSFGRHWTLLTNNAILVEGNVSIGIKSDYTGSERIAWIYTDNYLQNSSIRNNSVSDYVIADLLTGGADANKHHNFYFEGLTYHSSNIFENNMVRQTSSGVGVEAGWLNNSPDRLLNYANSGRSTYTMSPTISAVIPGDLSVTYNAGNSHYSTFDGQLVHVFGCFDVTVVHTTASGFLIVAAFPANGAILWKVGITGVDGGSGLTKKLANFRMNASAGTGLFFDENDDTVAITDIPTGTTIQIFYDGWYSQI